MHVVKNELKCMRVSGEHTLGGHPREWHFFPICVYVCSVFSSVADVRIECAWPERVQEYVSRRFTREIGHTHTAMQNENDKKRRQEKSGWRDEPELSTEYRDCSTQNTLASCTIWNAITINAMESNGTHTTYPCMTSDVWEPITREMKALPLEIDHQCILLGYIRV